MIKAGVIGRARALFIELVIEPPIALAIPSPVDSQDFDHGLLYDPKLPVDGLDVLETLRGIVIGRVRLLFLLSNINPSDSFDPAIDVIRGESELNPNPMLEINV